MDELNAKRKREEFDGGPSEEIEYNVEKEFDRIDKELK